MKAVAAHFDGIGYILGWNAPELAESGVFG
jgi:hypothetical protein